MLCLVGKITISITAVLISKTCYSRFGISFCICGEIAPATKRKVKGAKERRNNEGHYYNNVVKEEGFLH